MWYVTSQKNRASALGLQRVLGLGSYETAWTWLHKLRRAMVRPDRDRLSGWVEVDETFIGGLAEGAAKLLPRVHRVASLLKRWPLGTHQGAVAPWQLPYYLDEFTFRFNRRTSKSRRLSGLGAIRACENFAKSWTSADRQRSIVAVFAPSRMMISAKLPRSSPPLLRTGFR